MNYIKRIFLGVLLIVGGIVFSSAILFNKQSQPGKYEKILQSITEMLTAGHFSPKKIDDNFSKNIYHRYFEVLDPNKNIFLQSDITSLKKYETRIDDEMLGADVEFFLSVSQIFNKRIEEAGLQGT